MKKIFLGLVGLFLILSLVVPVSHAQIAEQNVILSCLEPENTDLILANGTLSNYSTPLYDKANIFKEENGPVYVLISYPVPGFKAEDSKFSDSCEHRHNSNLEGQYWFCADTKGNGSQCLPEMLAPNTQILEPKNAPKEPSDPDEGSCLKTIFNIENQGFVAGQFKVGSAQMYTLLHNNVQFWGLQYVNTSTTPSAGPTQGAPANTSLKLASFIGENSPGIPDGVNSNCTTVSWDPYGRIIDSLLLEPISNVKVSLKSTNNNNVLELYKNPLDPTFRNPFYTNSQGGFNFAVSPGSYYMLPEHSDFTFPVETEAYNKAIANLKVFDSLQEYFVINKPNAKSYLNPQESIIETAGTSQRRDIIMEPKNPSYQGSLPEVISISNSRQGIKQLLKGIVSHPNAIVKVLINNQEIAKTTTNIKGEFELYFNEKIPVQATSYQVVVEKVPLVKTNTLSKNIVSEKTILNLVPAALSGFIFNNNSELLPKTKVEIVLSSLKSISYATVVSDENGFIGLSQLNLPPTEFLLKIYPQDGSLPFEQTISQFLKLNEVYLKESGVNLYNPNIATENLFEPGINIINKVKSTPVNKPEPTTTIATQTKAPVFSLLSGIILLIALFVIAVLMFLKLRKPASPVSSVAEPELPPIPEL